MCILNVQGILVLCPYKFTFGLCYGISLQSSTLEAEEGQSQVWIQRGQFSETLSLKGEKEKEERGEEQGGELKAAEERGEEERQGEQSLSLFFVTNVFGLE